MIKIGEALCAYVVISNPLKCAPSGLFTPNAVPSGARHRNAMQRIRQLILCVCVDMRCGTARHRNATQRTGVVEHLDVTLATEWRASCREYFRTWLAWNLKGLSDLFQTWLHVWRNVSHGHNNHGLALSICSLLITASLFLQIYVRLDQSQL